MPQLTMRQRVLKRLVVLGLDGRSPSQLGADYDIAAVVLAERASSAGHRSLVPNQVSTIIAPLGAARARAVSSSILASPASHELMSARHPLWLEEGNCP